MLAPAQPPYKAAGARGLPIHVALARTVGVVARSAPTHKRRTQRQRTIDYV